MTTAFPQVDIQTEAQTRTTPERRVLFVIPGDPDDAPTMIFAKRQSAEVKKQPGIVGETFYLASRTSPAALFREAVRFRRVIRDFRPDVIHAHFGTMTAFFCAVLTLTPLVITYRGSDLNPIPSASWLRSAGGKLLSQLAALQASQIVCVSRQLKQRLWWRSGLVTVLPSGVDTTLFHPRPRSEARRELGWTEETPVVLFNAGREPAVKRLDLAQAAFHVALRYVPKARLVVLDGHVSPSRVPLLLSAADCLLVTSDWEGSPTIVQEALACRLPIVSVPVGDLEDRLKDVTHSCVVSRDPEALGKSMARVVTRPRRSNGDQLVRPASLESAAAALTHIYAKAVTGRGAAQS